MGWVTPITWQRVTVSDIDVIHVCYCCRADGACDGSNNEAIVDLAPDGTSAFSLSDIIIRNVRIETDAVHAGALGRASVQRRSCAAPTITYMSYLNLPLCVYLCP